MNIKSKLKQIREGSISHNFYTDSIRYSSPEYLMKVGVNTGVPKFPLDISKMLLLENLIVQNKLSPILIKKYGELEKNIKMLVLHQILLIKLSAIKKKEIEETIISKWLFGERTGCR